MRRTVCQKAIPNKVFYIFVTKNDSLYDWQRMHNLDEKTNMLTIHELLKQKRHPLKVRCPIAILTI